MDTVEITELEKIDADRVDGVRAPASGIPILLMKSTPEPAAKGARDCPKCEKSYDADHKGEKCENCGTKLPGAPAAKSADGDGPPPWLPAARSLAKMGAFPADLAWKALKAIDASGAVDERPDIKGGQQAIALLGKLIGYEAAELAAGNAGESADIQVLCSAVDALGFWMSGEQAVAAGNVKPATALMQSAAPEKPAGDAPDGAIAKEGTDVDTVTQEAGGLTKAVEEAIAKATAPLAQEIADLRSAKDLALAELAKVKATPVPGGPMMSVARPAKADSGEDPARKAAYYEDWADRVSSPEDADRYRQLAAQERSKITS